MTKEFPSPTEGFLAAFDPKTDPLLWKAATKDVAKLEDMKIPETEPSALPAPEPETLLPRKFSLPRSPFPLKNPGQKAGFVRNGLLDRKTEDRVRKGQMTLDGVLDLHGHTANMARQTLLNFLKASIQSGHRCVLVITGKGATAAQSQASDSGLWFEPKKGVIRREFHQWLEDASVKSHILSVSPAQPRHGGSGAFYVYLRRS